MKITESFKKISNVTVVLISILFALTIFLFFYTSISDSFNNTIHDTFPFWPVVSDDSIKRESFVVGLKPESDIEKRIINITTDSGTVSLGETDSANFKIQASYYQKRDKPLLNEKVADGLLTIDVTEKDQSAPLDYPLAPRETSEYKIFVGQADFLTDFNLKIYTHDFDMKLENQKVGALEINTYLNNTHVVISETSIPKNGLSLISDYGKVTLQLPESVTASIVYSLGEKSVLLVDKERFEEEKGVYLFKGAKRGGKTLPIEVLLDREATVTVERIENLAEKQ